MSLDVAAVRARRSEAVHYFRTIDSTMHEATRLAQLGCPSGTVVIADEQTAGMGRLRRSWHSESEAGIYCSVVLRPSLPPGSIPMITLMLGLATLEAIQTATNLSCDLRWPNDVLVGGAKVAGILAQLVESCVVAGIGINVNQTHFPEGLRTPATSLLLASGGSGHSREEILVVLLESIDRFSKVMKTEGGDAIRRAFTQASTYACGRRVVVEESGRHGTTAGLDESGFLLVRFDSGVTERIASGGIRPE